MCCLQRGNQTGQLQYHQFTNPHDIISQKDVPSGLQMTSTPLQLPGANGQAITLTRTNEGNARELSAENAYHFAKSFDFHIQNRNF